MLNKRAIIKKILGKLGDELEVYFRAAKFARAEATHEQNKAENKYDTRGLEASYLAHGQSKQAAELEAAITDFENLNHRAFAKGEPIGVQRMGPEDMGPELVFIVGVRPDVCEKLDLQAGAGRPDRARVMRVFAIRRKVDASHAH